MPRWGSWDLHQGWDRKPLLSSSSSSSSSFRAGDRAAVLLARAGSLGVDMAVPGQRCGAGSWCRCLSCSECSVWALLCPLPSQSKPTHVAVTRCQESVQLPAGGLHSWVAGDRRGTARERGQWQRQEGPEGQDFLGVWGGCSESLPSCSALSSAALSLRPEVLQGRVGRWPRSHRDAPLCFSSAASLGSVVPAGAVTLGEAFSAAIS